jgi:hypothetical protein
LAVAGAGVGGAQTVGGGGLKATDCWMTFASTPAPNFPPRRPTQVRCPDQDVACGDESPKLGYCSFRLAIIFNDSHFAPECVPLDLPGPDGFLIPFSGAANDDQPKHIPDFEVFEDFAQNTLPVTADMTDVASSLSSVTVPMQILFTSRGPMFRTTTLQMHPTLCSVPLVNGRCPPGAARDIDTFNLTCTPATDPVTRAKISPCTGIASTFQQIQEHIFDRKCSNLAACHGSMMAGNLCLKDPTQPCDGGSRTTYTDLLGQTPTNFYASSDGLKRVDADGATSGDPANSLIVHKINGARQLDSPSGGKAAYGVRMPFNDPLQRKLRRQLSRGEIQLISDWIQAGAPSSGFVATPALGACH